MNRAQDVEAAAIREAIAARVRELVGEVAPPIRGYRAPPAEGEAAAMTQIEVAALIYPDMWPESALRRLQRLMSGALDLRPRDAAALSRALSRPWTDFYQPEFTGAGTARKR